MNGSYRGFGAVMAAFFWTVSTGPAALGAPADGPCPETAACIGDKITAQNLDDMLGRNFQGHKLSDVMIERVVWQIREHNLEVTLGKSHPFEIDPHYAALNERNRTAVTYDAKTRRPVGWIGGVPFPDIDPADPHVGWKVAWNQAYGRSHGDSLHRRRFVWILIDGQQGVERVQHWNFRRIWMAGRYGASSDHHLLGDGTILYKEIFSAMAPQDPKGVGTFNIRYNTGAYDDTWAYIRDLRRVRRLSGGNWMDPLGSTDYLNDDFDVLGAFPTWYEDFRLIGRQMLVIDAKSTGHVHWEENAQSLDETFPTLELGKAPYWHPKKEWELRETFVVEAIPPADHPYSRKIAYINPDIWNASHGETYDKSGEFHKWLYQPAERYTPEDNPDGHAYWAAMGAAIDYQTNHGTIYAGLIEMIFNGPLTSEDISLGVLEAEGQ